MIYYLTKDLMMASNVQAAARGAALELKIVPSLEKLSVLAAETPAQKILVDLQTPGLSSDDIATLVEQVNEIDGHDSVPVIGYAQHVHVDLMQTAAQSGFTTVVTRGQIHHGAAEFLTA